MAGAFGSNEQNVVSRWWLDLTKMEVEPVAGHEYGPLLQVRQDRRAVSVPLQFVGQQDVDDVCLLDSIHNRQGLKTMAFGEIKILATGPLSHHNL